MKISTTDFQQPIHNDLKSLKHNDVSRENHHHDRARVSEKALMLSRHAATLNEQLQPRPEILRKFEGFADAHLDLDDATIDHILSRM